MTREEFNAERKQFEAMYEERMQEIAETSEEIGYAYGTTAAQAYIAEEMSYQQQIRLSQEASDRAYQQALRVHNMW